MVFTFLVLFIFAQIVSCSVARVPHSIIGEVMKQDGFLQQLLSFPPNRSLLCWCFSSGLDRFCPSLLGICHRELFHTGHLGYGGGGDQMGGC